MLKILRFTSSSIKTLTEKVLDPNFYVYLINNPQNIHQNNKILRSLAHKNFNVAQFENIWKKYYYYVCSLFDQVSKSKHQHQLEFLKNATIIFTKSGEVKGVNLIKTFNRTVNLLLQKYNQLTLRQQIQLIQCLTRYNIKKAKFVLTFKKNHIYKCLKQLDQHTGLILLDVMNKISYIDGLLVEQALDAIYPTIQDLSVQQMCAMLNHLGNTHRFINKEFFLKSTNRVVNLIKSQKINDGQLMKIMSSVSLIQKNMRGSALLDQLDPLYSYSITYLSSKLDRFRTQQISTFSSIIRRSKYDDQNILQNLVEQCLGRKVLELEFNNLDEYSDKPLDHQLISLQSLFKVFHTLAVCNFRSRKFIEYIISIIQLSYKSHPLPSSMVSRIIWSGCVLCSKDELCRLYPLMQGFFKVQNLPKHELMNFYYCYLLLKTYFPKITAHKDTFVQCLKRDYLQSTISEIHENIYNNLLEYGVPCLKEFNISNIMVDIMIPKWNDTTNVIIDVHGYHHFLRKSFKPQGSNQLKKKVVEQQGYYYYYISIDEWNLADNKHELIKSLMANIEEDINNKIKSKPKKLLIVKQ